MTSQLDKAQEEVNRGFGRMTALGIPDYGTYSVPLEFDLEKLAQAENWEAVVEGTFASSRAGAMRAMGAWVEGYREAKIEAEGEPESE